MSTGRFCWFDLMTTDADVSRAFYGELFGWQFRAHGGDYHMVVDRNGRRMGGTLAAPPGQPSAWMPYLTTDDLEATVARVRADGGRVFLQHVAEGIGPFAIFADRQGAALGTIQLGGEEPPYPREKGEHHITWSELHTPDPADAIAFHTALFAWSTESWGPDYTLIGDEHAGGITRGRPGEPAHWLIYVNTPDTDATARRVVALGGRVLLEPQQMGDVGRFAVFADPTGAVFAVMQSAPRG